MSGWVPRLLMNYSSSHPVILVSVPASCRLQSIAIAKYTSSISVYYHQVGLVGGTVSDSLLSTGSGL